MFKAALVTAIAIASAQAMAATPTRYLIDHSIGAYGKVTGTLDTDGTLGVLGALNILDWDLTLNADQDLTTVGRLLGPLSGGNSSLVLSSMSANPLSALYTAGTSGQASGLYFDFGGGPTQSWQLFQIKTQDFGVVWQGQAGGPFSDELIRESDPLGYNPVQAFSPHGKTVIQFGASISPVPEPSALLLLALGLTTLFAFRRSHIKR